MNKRITKLFQNLDRHAGDDPILQAALQHQKDLWDLDMVNHSCKRCVHAVFGAELEEVKTAGALHLEYAPRLLHCLAGVLPKFDEGSVYSFDFRPPFSCSHESDGVEGHDEL